VPNRSSGLPSVYFHHHPPFLRPPPSSHGYLVALPIPPPHRAHLLKLLPLRTRVLYDRKNAVVFLALSRNMSVHVSVVPSLPFYRFLCLVSLVVVASFSLHDFMIRSTLKGRVCPRNRYLQLIHSLNRSSSLASSSRTSSACCYLQSHEAGPCGHEKRYTTKGWRVSDYISSDSVDIQTTKATDLTILPASNWTSKTSEV
jgi:hypothetical protein